MRLLIVLTLTYFTLAFAPPAHATLQYFGYYNVNGLSPWVDYQDHIPEIESWQRQHWRHYRLCYFQTASVFD